MAMILLGVTVLALLLLRVPVAFAILGPSVVYLVATGSSLELGLRTAINGVDSWPLLAVPLFVLLGVIANHAGIADRLFDFALALFGRVRGGLAYVNIGSSVGFSWMSGSALADAAGLGTVQVPAMQREGYPTRFAVGLTGASSLISPVMPPSIPAVVFASVAGVSTGALFAASVLPAFLIAFGLVVCVWLWSRRQTFLKTRAFRWQAVLETGKRAIAGLLTPVVVIGGILTGAFTPTEAAAVGCVYMLILGFAYRTLTIRDLAPVLRNAAVTSAAIMIIIGATSLLGWILAKERVPGTIAQWMTDLTDSPTVFLFLAVALLIVLGAIMEPTSALVLSVPILLPVAKSFGIDPIHFGVIVVLTLMIGLLTPPVGPVAFVLSSVTKIPVREVFRGLMPFMIPLITVVILLVLFPSLIWLPGL
ncbi:TRAP transporter large permease [Ornithinimicrobium sp. F0845]|uniref:TRAP transporter large permease n=1 Tax=Ornithinimicrobium sp. F0845 TaxID=2926412 RepID=UPI001FF22FAD|nr:TRAP transporter large permease [Ornithinimicrobium sp. F0845]MCK0112045.1 TRAP transporter large permease [Ornithinimicrobium sp. F0845]